MAMVQCPECRHEVSSAAQMCPKCGFGVGAYLAHQHQQRVQAEQHAKKMQRQKIVGGAILAVLGSVFLCCTATTCIGKRGAEEAQREAEVARQEAERQQAEAKVRRQAQVRENLADFEASIEEAIESKDPRRAQSTLNAIVEAIPDYAKASLYSERITALQMQVVAAQKTQQAQTLFERATDKIKEKEFLDAEDILVELEATINGIPEDQRTPDNLALLSKAQKEKGKVASKAKAMRAKLEKERAQADRRAERCGGATECIEITAQSLCSQYANNEVRADEQYRGKTLIITGWIDDISKSLFESMSISLRTSYKCLGMVASIPEYQKATVAKLNQGDKVTLRCKGGGMVITQPIINDCSIVEYWQ